MDNGERLNHKDAEGTTNGRRLRRERPQKDSFWLLSFKQRLAGWREAMVFQNFDSG
jgi:hypothetical protein